jgi:hypothetical protein
MTRAIGQYPEQGLQQYGSRHLQVTPDRTGTLV